MTLFLQSLQSLGRLLGDTANKRTFLRRPNWQFVVLATTVAFCLAVFCLDCHSLWLAEGVAYGRAHIPLHKIMAHIAGGDGHPPLYFWLMHGWLTLGTTEFWMRLPSVIFFTLTVPVVYVIGRTISTPRAGVYATFLFATAPFLMSWAQVARGYAMLTFFCSVALMSLALILYRYDARRPAFIGAGLREMCLGRAQHRETGWAPAIRDDLIWLAYILSVVAALLTHNTAVLLPVVTGLIFIVAIGFAPDFKWRHTLNFAVAHLFVALLYGWYLPYLLDGVARIKRSFYVKSVSVEQVKRAFYSVYGNEYIPLMLLAFFCLFIVALSGALSNEAMAVDGVRAHRLARLANTAADCRCPLSADIRGPKRSSGRVCRSCSCVRWVSRCCGRACCAALSWRACCCPISMGSLPSMGIPGRTGIVRWTPWCLSPSELRPPGSTSIGRTGIVWWTPWCRTRRATTRWSFAYRGLLIHSTIIGGTTTKTVRRCLAFKMERCDALSSLLVTIRRSGEHLGERYVMSGRCSTIMNACGSSSATPVGIGATKGQFEAHWLPMDA